METSNGYIESDVIMDQAKFASQYAQSLLLEIKKNGIKKEAN